MASSVRRFLYCWGNGDFGRLGMGSNLSSFMVPTKCEALSETSVSDVACGGAHTVALTGTTVEQDAFDWSAVKNMRICGFVGWDAQIDGFGAGC